MFGFQFNVGPSRAKLREARELLSDMTPVYLDIGEYVVGATQKRFVQGVAPDGSRWAPKSPTTLKRYKRLGYGSLGKPLIGAGRRLSREIQKIVTSSGVTVGSSLIYSGVMQDGAAKGAFGKTSRGGPIPWGRIPARVWLGLSAADDAAIVGIVDEALDAKLDG